MKNIGRTGAVRNAEQRIAQRRCCVEKFRLDAQRTQRSPLQAGAAGDAIVAPKRGDNDHPTEIPFPRTAAQHVLGEG